MAHAVSGLRRIVDSWISWRDRRALERSPITLEQQVTQRTAALSARNDQLRRRVEELEAAKLRAEAASKAKSDFLANMSHELRTPLNAIIGFSDLMKSEVLGPIGSDSYRGYVSDIHFSGCHLLEIINDILDVVRHESGKMELKEEIIAIDDVIADALRLMAPQATEAKVSLDWHPSAAALPGLYCDRVRVRQMFAGSPDVAERAVQRSEIHRAWGPRRDQDRGDERAGADGPGHGHRHQAGRYRAHSYALRAGRIGLFAQPSGRGARPELDESPDRAPWGPFDPLQRARSWHDGAAVLPGRPVG
jgi:hypothetical protein